MLMTCNLYLLQVRDAALKIKEQIPKSDVNKEYFVQNMDSEV